ncbi:hypothetical protein [Kingella oralis]|uniref:Uncharacterized protein n=1 Tax=Kingella oralis ATCC 51147 TaxID=629741 RepID=C4GFI0_9NEIS|nr:hypothetical protein [Kingella oralis]EEP68985.1 hypothetical protein GCWU000324_00896 [Kingella oralis ATCC 51147]QMT41864.1 hypothetical protein H3L93_07340 [Kingella oralis]
MAKNHAPLFANPKGSLKRPIPFQAAYSPKSETFANPATDGASAAYRPIFNQPNHVESTIWRRAVAAPC